MNLWNLRKIHRKTPVSEPLFNKVTSVRSSHRRCSVRKSVLRNFAKFTGKHQCQSLFLNKVAGLKPATLLHFVFCRNKLYKNIEAEILRLGNVKTKKILQNTLQKNDLNAIKNIKKVKVKEQSQKHKLSMYYARVTIKFVYNVKMRKNHRPFTGTEINVKLS